MSVLINLLTGNRVMCKAVLSNNVVKQFISSSLRYSQKDVQANNIDINEIDENNTAEVYSGPLSNQIRAVKLLSLVTSMGGLALQPVLIQKANEFNTHIAVVIGAGTFIGFFTFVTPLLLHLITKKYVRTILYHEQSESYIAKTYTIFLRDKVVIFKPEDVVVPDVPGMFTSFLAKGVPLFVEAGKFKDIVHYKKIMGYDKPLDFKLSKTDKKDS